MEIAAKQQEYTLCGFPVVLSSAVKRGTILMSPETLSDLQAFGIENVNTFTTDTVKSHVWGQWRPHGFGYQQSISDHRACVCCGLSDTYVIYTGDAPCKG